MALISDLASWARNIAAGDRQAQRLWDSFVGSVSPGIVQANKALLAGPTKNLDTLDIASLLIGGVAAGQEYGCAYFSSSAETTIAEAGTFVKAAGTTTLAASTANISMPANNRLPGARRAQH